MLYSREQRASVDRLLTENEEYPGDRKNLPMKQNVVSDQPLSAQKKSLRSLYSPTQNNRWKWMIGATAATATGATTAQAGLVSINLTGNFISAVGGNHLNADLTGDGQPDLVISNAFYAVTTNSNGPGFIQYIARVNLNGVLARAAAFAYDGVGFLTLGSHSKFFGFSSHSGSLTGSIPVSFKDLHINGGALTKGSLQVTVLGKVVPSEPGEPNSVAKVQLDSLTFHTPDNGSTLTLLAMGATGVLALRRSRATQKHLQG